AFIFHLSARSLRFTPSLHDALPISALSGVVASYILAVSRAVGETMVVAIAAGQQPDLTWDPTESAATITAYIVQVSMGDVAHGRSEEHTSELQSRENLVCRLLLEKK